MHSHIRHLSLDEGLSPLFNFDLHVDPSGTTPVCAVTCISHTFCLPLYWGLLLQPAVFQIRITGTRLAVRLMQ